MIDVVLSILALIAGGLTLELFASAFAPLTDLDGRGVCLSLDAGGFGEEYRAGNPS